MHKNFSPLFKEKIAQRKKILYSLRRQADAAEQLTAAAKANSPSSPRFLLAYADFFTFVGSLKELLHLNNLAEKHSHFSWPVFDL